MAQAARITNSCTTCDRTQHDAIHDLINAQYVRLRVRNKDPYAHHMQYTHLLQAEVADANGLDQTRIHRLLQLAPV
jgi:hypothetical protein